VATSALANQQDRTHFSTGFPTGRRAFRALAWLRLGRFHPRITCRSSWRAGTRRAGIFRNGLVVVLRSGSLRCDALLRAPPHLSLRWRPSDTRTLSLFIRAWMTRAHSAIRSSCSVVLVRANTSGRASALSPPRPHGRAGDSLRFLGQATRVNWCDSSVRSLDLVDPVGFIPGLLRLRFARGIMHYDPPPPLTLTDVDACAGG